VNKSESLLPQRNHNRRKDESLVQETPQLADQGERAQRDAATSTPEAPGQPAGGE
jgi:hypothetical protein